MLPPIPNNIVHLIAIAGVAFLLIWWLFHPRSGTRGFGLAVLGCAIIVAIGYGWNNVRAFLAFLQVAVVPFALAAIFVVVLAFVLIALLGRRRKAEDIAAEKPVVYDRCPECHQLGYLHEYQIRQGRHGRMIMVMCNDCAGRKDAKPLYY